MPVYVGSRCYAIAVLVVFHELSIAFALFVGALITCAIAKDFYTFTMLHPLLEAALIFVAIR